MNNGVLATALYFYYQTQIISIFDTWFNFDKYKLIRAIEFNYVIPIYLSISPVHFEFEM